ncbi:MAG: hypothetical protein ABIS38_06890 [Sphingomicrobium sp.]
MLDEKEAKRRFLLFTLARLGGLIVFFIGIAIAYSDVLREGGWPQVGVIIAALGAIDSLFAPLLLKRGWDKADK